MVIIFIAPELNAGCCKNFGKLNTRHYVAYNCICYVGHLQFRVVIILRGNFPLTLNLLAPTTVGARINH